MKITTCRNDSIDASELQSLYRNHKPWKCRSEEEVAKIIEYSEEVVGLREQRSGDLVASARALTDYVKYATIHDVIVSDDYRNEGLGKRVISEITGSEELQNVYLTLQCREELVPFYESCGFKLHDQNVSLEAGSTITYRMMLYSAEAD